MSRHILLVKMEAVCTTGGSMFKSAADRSVDLFKLNPTPELNKFPSSVEVNPPTNPPPLAKA